VVHTTEAHTQYSAIHGFWPVEELSELAEGPTGCGEVARGGCLFACNFRVTRHYLYYVVLVCVIYCCQYEFLSY
jgi:hypothetical protein